MASNMGKTVQTFTVVYQPERETSHQILSTNERATLWATVAKIRKDQLQRSNTIDNNWVADDHFWSCRPSLDPERKRSLIIQTQGENWFVCLNKYITSLWLIRLDGFLPLLKTVSLENVGHLCDSRGAMLSSNMGPELWRSAPSYTKNTSSTRRQAKQTTRLAYV